MKPYNFREYIDIDKKLNSLAIEYCNYLFAMRRNVAFAFIEIYARIRSLSYTDKNFGLTISNYHERELLNKMVLLFNKYYNIDETTNLMIRDELRSKIFKIRY